jgi:pyruvate/2-oxoglutarate dehydrogenase complex dihydrolipoamide acyltransferase (E2) component
MSKKSFFSRPDGKYLRDIDPFMRFFPFMMKGRNDSAVYFKQQVDVTALRAYINAQNREAASESGDGVMSTLFYGILTAIIKTMIERPQTNRFIIGHRIYQRNRLSCAFVIKSEFRDNANEEIAIMNFEQDDTLKTISERMAKEIRKARETSRQQDKARHGAVNWLNLLMKFPRIVLRGFMRFISWLDYHGWLPRFVVDADPMHTSIFISNLGSLKIDAPFHHLYEWGTTSFFVTIGAIQKIPMVMSDGTTAIRDTINLAITVDERISDGYYFAKTVRRVPKSSTKNPRPIGGIKSSLVPCDFAPTIGPYDAEFSLQNRTVSCTIT